MEPWIFGYWTVLSSRYDLSGCEAKLTSFQECDLFQKMPVSMQDALRIYHKLCEKIRKFGHTYVYLSQLKGWETNVKHWEESLSYLSSIDAVETCDDHLGDERIVFLPYLRQFEQRIANNLSCIMHKEPWIGNIDVEQQVIVSGFKYACVLTMQLRWPVLVFFHGESIAHAPHSTLYVQDTENDCGGVLLFLCKVTFGLF